MLPKIDKNLLILFAGLILGVGLGFISSTLLRENKPVSVVQTFQVFDGGLGFIAVDFELKSLSGDAVQLSALQGKPVMINFWATWCGPCELEMPLIQKYYEKNTSDLEVLAINADEPLADIHSFVDRLGLSFPVLLDPGGKIADLYKVNGYPTTYFIDREGTVQGFYVGTLTKGLIEKYLKKIGVGE